MITEAEADIRAAALVLDLLAVEGRDLTDRAIAPEDRPAIRKALKPIEQWLRRRALGNEKIAIRQIEKELGNQVRMKGEK